MVAAAVNAFVASHSSGKVWAGCQAARWGCACAISVHSYLSAAEVSSHRRRVSSRMNFSSKALRSLSEWPGTRW